VTVWQGDLYSYLQASLLDVLSPLLSQSVYTELRTKEQLGYIVTGRAMQQYGVQSLLILVQSPSYDPIYIDNRIHDFMSHTWSEQISKLSEKRFEEMVKGAIQDKLAPAASMADQRDLYFAKVISGTYDFDRTEKEIARLKTVTMQDFLDFNEYILFANSTQKRLSIQLFAARFTPPHKEGKKRENRQNAETANLTLDQVNSKPILDVNIFKRSRELYSHADPSVFDRELDFRQQTQPRSCSSSDSKVGLVVGIVMAASVMVIVSGVFMYQVYAKKHGPDKRWVPLFKIN